MLPDEQFLVNVLKKKQFIPLTLYSHLLSFENWYDQKHPFLFSALSSFVQQQKITIFARAALTFTSCFGTTGPIKKTDKHNSSSSRNKKGAQQQPAEMRAAIKNR